MRLSISSGLSISGHQTGSAGGSGNVTTTFGALTLEGAGGVAVTGTSISSGDASGHWQISGGEISPSATGEGALSGPYSLVLDDGQEVNITIVADTYTVKALGAQIDAANVDHVVNGVSAATIAIRPGNITDGTTGDAGAGFLDDRTWLNRDYSTKRLTITSVDDNNRAEFRDWRALVQGSNNLRFEGVVFRQTGTSFEGVFISDGGVTTTAIQVVNCEFYGRTLDYTLDWYASPETGYTDPNRPRLVTALVLTSTVGATVEDNLFQGLYIAGAIRMEGTVSFQRNTASLCYYDLYNMVGPTGVDASTKTVKDNVGWGVFGARWNVGPGPHGDGFQHTSGRIDNAIFENNWIGMGQVGTTHNGDDQQTWFTNFVVNDTVFLRNLFTGQALHGITLQQAVNVVIDQCTVMEADPENPVGQLLKPTVNITNSGTGVRHVRDTITASSMNLGSGNIDDNNVVVATSGGDYTVSASFEGGTFGAETLADALAAFTPKSTGDVTGLGAITTAGAFRTGARPPAASPAPSLSVSGTTLTVTVADTIWNGGSAVTSQDIRYSTDETNWTTVTGVTSPHDITGLSPSTLYYVQTRDNNAAGTGTAWSASTTETTEGAVSFTANGIDNGGTRYAQSISYSTGTMGKAGTVSLWVYYTGDAGTLIQMRNSAGNERFRLITGGTGNLLIEMKNSAGTQIAYRLTNASALTSSAWNHVLISWDLAATTIQVYINDTVVSSFASSPTPTDAAVEDCTRIGVFDNYGGGSIFDGDLSEIWMDTVYRDLSSSANRRNFITAGGAPEDLTSYASPHLYLHNPAASFGTNSGSGGNLTAVGTGSFADVTPPS